MNEAEAFRRLEETCSMGHGPTVRKRRDCMTCQVLLLVEVANEEIEAAAQVTDSFGHRGLSDLIRARRGAR